MKWVSISICPLFLMDEHNFQQNKYKKEDSVIADTRGMCYRQDEEFRYPEGNNSYHYGSSNKSDSVCMWISNFHPALVPPPETISESDVEDYFQDMPNDTSDEIDSDENY